MLALVLMGIIASAITSSLGRESRNILEHNYRSVLAAQRMTESLQRMDSGALFIVAGEEGRARHRASGAAPQAVRGRAADPGGQHHRAG